MVHVVIPVLFTLVLMEHSVKQLRIHNIILAEIQLPDTATETAGFVGIIH